MVALDEVARLPSENGSQCSVLGRSPMERARQATEAFDFDLGRVKALVQKEMEQEVELSKNFLEFFKCNQLYVRLLNSLLLMFTAMFQLDWLVETMASPRQHLEGYNPYTVSMRQQELEEEIAKHRAEVSPVYSVILMRHANYRQPLQDRMFFEAMYESLALVRKHGMGMILELDDTVLDHSFAKLDKRTRIEEELDLMFRTRHFNMRKRHAAPPRTVETLSIRELHSIKTETVNPALNSRLLASLYERPRSLPVQLVSISHSPLISSFMASNQAVARAAAQDPLTRTKRKLRSLPQPAPAQQPCSLDLSRSQAMLRGVCPRKLKLPQSTATTSGAIPEERESGGLPVDDAFTYLSMLRRYVIHGPHLGLEQRSMCKRAPGELSMNPERQGSIMSGSGRVSDVLRLPAICSPAPMLSMGPSPAIKLVSTVARPAMA